MLLTHILQRTEQNFELLGCGECRSSFIFGEEQQRKSAAHNRLEGARKTARKGRAVQAIEDGRTCFGNREMGLQIQAAV